MHRLNKEAKVSNFQQIENVLRTLKIKFDAKQINQIMNEERGAALKLLHQLKLAIQKLKDPQMHQTQSGLKPSVLENKMQETQALMQSLQQTNNLQTMNKSKKLELVEKNLFKFEHAKNLQTQQAIQKHKEEEALIQKLHQDARQEGLKKMEENQQYMKDWEAEGTQNWKKNQQNRKDTIATVKHFEDREVKIFKDKLSQELDEATIDMIGGIDDFDKNLEKLGIEKNTSIQDAIKKMEEKKGVPPGQIQNFSYAATMNKIKEKKNMSDFATKERERRRRKLIVDQIRIKEGLDTKKSESQLIEKFKKKQKEEQSVAYLDWRNLECKQLIYDNRTQKAQEADAQRKQQQELVDQRKNEEYASKQEQFKQEMQLKLRFHTQARREEFMRKRQLNIEICSEILDAIFDVGDEVFQQINKGDFSKLPKPEWRSLKDKFVNKKRIQNAMDISISSLKEDNEQDDTFKGTIDTNMELEEILDQKYFTQEYYDLLSYLSITGEFNLSSRNLQEWFEMKNLYQNFDYQLPLPPYNDQLGSRIQDLFSFKDNQSTTSEKLNKEAQGLNQSLTLKLSLIGRSFAGKRTVAKQISDLSPGKIKIFKMEDLIKEAIDYVAPKPVAEAVPQGKNVKKVANKVEEVVDPYAGQDTTVFKEIGRQLKQIAEENNEELKNSANYDKLLVRLFIAKLKLVFSPEQPETVRIEELKKNIAREKEVMQQLAEIEQQNQLQNEKAPAKGKVDNKKGNKPSNEEQLRAELQLLQKIQLDGWILLDFPKTLEQSKLMEQYVTGYVSILDKPKSKESKKEEAWQKLVAVPSFLPSSYDGQPALQTSCFDGVLLLDVPSEECQRRSTNRKIDPQTGNIYHLEDNPPPEGDKKLNDRLQEYTEAECDPEKMQNNYANFDAQEKPLEKWMSTFGLSQSGLTSVGLLRKVKLEDKTKKEDVQNMVMGHVQKIIDFKQGQYDCKKQIIKLQMEEQQQEQEQPAEPIQETQQEEQVADTVNPSEFQDEKELKTQQSQVQKMKQSARNFMRRNSMCVLGEDDKKKAWNEFVKNYYIDMLEIFRNVKKQRTLVFEELNNIQNQFINFLQRADTKQNKINHFVDSFNKFSEEFPDLRQDEQTKQELLNRAEQLSNDLWTLIDVRKEEALVEHQRIVNTGWIQVEMKKLLLFGVKIIQAELSKYITAYQMVTSVTPKELALNAEETFNVMMLQGVEVLKSGQTPPILNELLMTLFSRLEQHVQAEVDSIDEKDKAILKTELSILIFRINMIKTWLSFKLQEFESNSSKVFQYMDDWIVVAVQKENTQAQDVISILRQAIYQKQSRLEHHQLFLDPIHLDIEISILEFRSEDLPIYMQQVQPPNDLNECRFKIDWLEMLYKQFRYLSSDECIDEQAFIHLMVLAYQENRIPSQWRYKDIIDIINFAQKFRIDNDSSSKNLGSFETTFLNWKQILTIFLFLEGDASLSQLEEYIEKLSQIDANQVQVEDMKVVDSWVDNQLGLPESKVKVLEEEEEDEYDEEFPEVDQDRITRIKTLLHQTHIRSTAELYLGDLKEALESLTREAEGNKYSALIFDH